ncbi:MAG: peptide chain release factor 2 [Dehalococcoidia bacterium]|nr:peptide chain release factor 2 [Dehalococcoidia bacterium]
MQDLRLKLTEMCQKIESVLVRLDAPGTEAEIGRLEQEAGSPAFWDDPQQARRSMQHLSRLKEKVSLWRDLEERTSTLLELTDLAIDDGDTSLEGQLIEETEQVSRTLDLEEFNLIFSGPYDERPAILSVHAGAGGTESQDWAEMLLRMYIRWTESLGRKAQILDLSHGDEAGIKSVTIEIGGQYAYGYLKAERGVHRLVRLSPFDANHLRHTSFALIEALPAAEEDPEINVKPDDLKIEFFRSSGPGGQNVQKVASAVRIIHQPTGIVVACQNERSQHQNREFAMKILMARLLERQLQERAREMSRIKGEHVSAEWGNQIRSYVLHPYKMVKDHRTGYQTSDPDGVLEGSLDEFMKAYLLSNLGKE